MKNIILVLISLSVLGLAGCDQPEQKKEQPEKGKVKQKIMGDGNKPMPKLSDYEK